MAGPTAMSERASRIVTLVASLWFAFTAFWGLFGIVGGGHLGAGSVGNVMAAEQMVRWHIWYPAWDWYTGIAPTKENYICHHPFGQYYVPALLLWIFGHHDFVARLPAALMCAAVPPLLYGIAKEKWGPASGAVAAASYVVVPLALGYSNFTNLENFCIFGALLFFWGHSRHTTTRKHRYLVASLIGLLFACSGDWCGYLLIAPTVVWTFLHAFVLPRRIMPRIDFPSYARWWGLSVGLVAGTLLFWLLLYAKVDQLAAWVLSAAGRGGAGSKLKDVFDALEARKYWIDFSFTPLAIKLGKLALPVCLLRLLVKRDDEESYSLSLLFGATVQYVAFKQGADIHIFWSIYFAPYYALALAQLVRTIGAVVGWIVGRFAPARRGPTVAWVALGLGLAPPLMMSHDAFASLWVWRRTGGRYDDSGTLIRSNIDEIEVVEQVIMPQTTRGMGIDSNGTSGWGWEQQWKWQGPNTDASMPQARGKNAAVRPFWIGRGSGLLGDIQRRVAAAAHVRIYGDTWVIDQREAAGPVDVYDLAEREPNVFEWLWIDGTEPRRKVSAQPNPWLTWEYRTHLDQEAFEPTREPVTLDEIRVAYNLAIAKHDAAAARQWREKIDGALDRTKAVGFDSWVRLIGVRLIDGVQPRVESWFEVTEPPAGDVQFDVISTIEARAKMSLIPVDKVDRAMAFPPSLPTKLWKPGCIYKTVTVLNHRIGRERYAGHWVSRDGSPAPRRTDRKPDTTLAVVE